MTFERTDDIALIRGVLRHPRIYRHITDDTCPPRERFEPQSHPAIWYVTVRDARELLGLFAFYPSSGIRYEVHTCLLPCAWGPRALEAARGVVAWMFAHSACRRIVTSVPAYNRLALGLARAAGLAEFGRDPQAFLKHGTLHDLILLGVSKG